jgi:excisionase family DNA binding protein
LEEKTEILGLDPQFLSVKEVSSLLGVSESTCRRLVSKGEFEAIKANTAVRIEVASLERWIRSPRY